MSSSIAVAGASGLAVLLLLRQRKRRTEPIEFDHELFSTSTAVDHPTLDNLQGASWKECQASFLDLSTEFIELLPVGYLDIYRLPPLPPTSKIR